MMGIALCMDRGRTMGRVIFLTAAMAMPVVACAGTLPAVMKTPDMTATTLIVLGLVLLLLEIKIISQGLLGFLASVCLIAATVIIWRDGASFWGVPVLWVIPVIGLILALGLALSVMAVKAYNEKVVTGYEGFVGEIAEVSENLNPEGRVFFQGSYWLAESSEPVMQGGKVRVVSVSKLKLFVKPLVEKKPSDFHDGKKPTDQV